MRELLNHLVGPRPICFASTVDSEGRSNLSPFSYFNMFSIEPPILIFSVLRRMRDNTTKHTLQNILEVPEATINVVSYAMVQQVSLASCEYYKGVDEFIKAGFTKEPSLTVRPPRVKESPASFECKVLEVKPLGNNGGAGNLVICKVLHVRADENFARSPDFAARLGGNLYARINHNNMFEVEKPDTRLGIGIDALPGHIRWSKTLTGNHLGMLANVEALPVYNPTHTDERLPSEAYAVELLEKNKITEAWQVLLSIQHDTI